MASTLGNANRQPQVVGEGHCAPHPIQSLVVAQAGRAGQSQATRRNSSTTVRTCRQLVERVEALWSCLEKPGIEPTNNATDRALRQSVIHRKISHDVQSASGAICRSRLLTVTATLRQQGRDLWSFLEQAWVAHRLSGVMPSLVPDG